MAMFDLIYLSREGERTMSCAVVDGENTSLIGPFPAAESGPAIVEALFNNPAFGFADKKDAENHYIMAHFRNMSRGENDAGQAYPMRLP